MNLTRRDLALALAMTPGIGGRTLTRVLARNDLLAREPEEFLRLSAEALREEYRLNQKTAAAVAASGPELAERVKPLRDRLEKLGVSLVTAADAHYPTLLEGIDPDPPGVLFLHGNAKLLAAQTFSVLSSQRTSAAGLAEIERLTEQGVLRGEVLVAGHDRPEYQRAAVVPLRWGAPRILCLDRGLFAALGPDLKDEPFRAARLWRYQFDPATDLAVSPFRPESAFVGANNRVRDRLVACLSRRIDFVEVAAGGTMDRLLRLALAAGRPVRVTERTAHWRELAEAGAGEVAHGT